MPISLVPLLLASCHRAEESPPREPPPPEPTPAELPVDAPGDLRGMGKPITVRGRDLVLLAQGAEIHVSYLEAKMVPSGDLVDLTQPASFSIDVEAIEIRLPEQSLKAAFDRDDEQKPPFTDVEVTTEGDVIRLEGHARTLHLPFTFEVDPAVLDGGTLALQLEQVHVLGIGVKGFVGAFEGEIENAANKRQPRLLDVEKDVLILNPFPFGGPPEIHASFSSVEVHEQALVARLGEPPDAKDRPPEPSLVLSGGVLRNDKTVLFDTTLALVPKDGGPLVIDPDKFPDQIAAGYTKLGDDRITIHLANPKQVEQEDVADAGDIP
jgi:hypothetical protein